MMIGPFPGSPHKIDGGAASALVYLCQALTARSDVELVGVRISDTTTASGAPADFGWPVYDLQLGRLGLATRYREQRLQFSTLLNSYRPDVVHAQGIDLPGYIAIRSGVPAVVTVHGILGEETKFGSDARTRIRSYLMELLLERPTVRGATDLISISPYVTRHYSSMIRGRVHDVPNAIAPKYFDIERKPERGRLLFAGRIIRRKGVLDLVKALSRTGDRALRLVIAGAATDSEYDALVRREIASHGMGERVEFRGLLDESHMLTEYSLAEALVLPSYQETAPMVIQQAMAAGLAVVATRICGVPFQVDNGRTGLLYETGAVDELARLLVQLHDEPSLASTLGQAGRIVARNRYHAASVAEMTVCAYRRALEAHREDGRAQEAKVGVGHDAH